MFHLQLIFVLTFVSSPSDQPAPSIGLTTRRMSLGFSMPSLLFLLLCSGTSAPPLPFPSSPNIPISTSLPNPLLPRWEPHGGTKPCRATQWWWASQQGKEIDKGDYSKEVVVLFPPLLLILCKLPYYSAPLGCLIVLISSFELKSSMH